MNPRYNYNKESLDYLTKAVQLNRTMQFIRAGIPPRYIPAGDGHVPGLHHIPNVRWFWAIGLTCFRNQGFFPIELSSCVFIIKHELQND
jgi:hypothetical protein